MPPDDRLRLNNGNSEEQSVGYCQPRFRGDAPAQHVQLMPQQDDLGFQPRPRPERQRYDVEGLRNAITGISLLDPACHTSADGVFGRDRTSLLTFGEPGVA